MVELRWTIQIYYTIGNRMNQGTSGYLFIYECKDSPNSKSLTNDILKISFIIRVWDLLKNIIKCICIIKSLQWYSTQ